MMARYRVTVPFIPSMGSIAPFIATDSYGETKQQNALWTINNMRDHDGLPHLTRLPRGTNFERVD
jgi:hypothetical protein